jgi:TolB-like protein/class 3 adenylate cyclase/Tfp pilus assembly protein PilF
MSQEAKLDHRLAAIMATDVVGYSKLIQTDEAGTLAALGLIRTAIENQISHYRGRIANTAGDSVLAEFASAVEAVQCAIAIQQALAGPGETKGNIQVRIGIHMGDVVSKGSDLFGMAVNIAARLEGIAPPCGIVVSSAVRDDVVGKLVASFVDLGMRTLKNIDQPVRVYSLSVTGSSLGSRTEHPPLPDKPSIAVLPFDNLSGDREQEYFADGIVEEIITALSRFRGLFVIARNSSFAYKGRAVDVKQVGRELGVRYILEGSVRKGGSKLRITGQLIDSATGAHLWADRFEGTLEDVFDLQDQVTANVIGAISPKLEEAEIDRAKRKPTESLDAYDYYLRGLAVAEEITKEANEEALRMFKKAIERDPDFVLAYARAAHCYVYRKANGWMLDRAQETAEASWLARRAVAMGRGDAVALCYGALALTYVTGDIENGAAFANEAVALNPNLAAGWSVSGWIKLCLGEVDVAIQHTERAMRLSPLDRGIFLFRGFRALAHFCAGRYNEGALWAESALRDQPQSAFAMRVAAASHAMAGRTDDAERLMAQLRQVDPQLRISNFGGIISPLQPEHRAKYIEGLRLAGLPE